MAAHLPGPAAAAAHRSTSRAARTSPPTSPSRRSTGRRPPAGLSILGETTQADWLRSLGVDELVEEARAAWHGRTANDLAALAARSRVHEAEALLDPAGLGAHRVTLLGKKL